MGNPEQIKAMAAMMGQKKAPSSNPRETFLRMLKENPSWASPPSHYMSAPQVIGNNG